MGRTVIKCCKCVFSILVDHSHGRKLFENIQILLKRCPDPGCPEKALNPLCRNTDNLFIRHCVNLIIQTIRIYCRLEEKRHDFIDTETKEITVPCMNFTLNHFRC